MMLESHHGLERVRVSYRGRGNRVRVRKHIILSSSFHELCRDGWVGITSKSSISTRIRVRARQIDFINESLAN